MEPEMSHKAEFILEEFISVLIDHNLHNFTRYTVTTDDGSNCSGKKGLPSQFVRTVCRDHKLSTCLRTVFSKNSKAKYAFLELAEDVFNLIDSAKELVTSFIRGGLNPLLHHKLKQSNDTRWNSLCVMLESILMEYDIIFKLCFEKGHGQLISKIDRKLLEEIVNLLKPFSNAIQILEVYKKPAIQCVLNEFNKLKQHLQRNLEDSKSVKNLRKVLLEVFLDKFDLHVLYKVAAFLDPRQKNALHKLELTTYDLQEIEEEIFRLGQILFKIETTDGDCSDETPIPAKKRILDIFDDCDEIEKQTLDPIQNLKDEIILYRNFPFKKIQNQEFDILFWWKNHQQNFKLLSKIARTVLATPPSSAKPEGDFSGASYVKSQRRYNLSPDSLSELISTRANM